MDTEQVLKKKQENNQLKNNSSATKYEPKPNAQNFVTL